MSNPDTLIEKPKRIVDITLLPDNYIEIPANIADKILPNTNQTIGETTEKTTRKKYNYTKKTGRPKGSLNRVNKEVKDILSRNKDSLIQKAVELAKEGNTAILCKLLDKVAPTLNENTNRNFDMNYRDEMEQLKKKAVELGLRKG